MKKNFHYIFNSTNNFQFVEKIKRIIESYLLSFILVIISYPLLLLIDFFIVNFMGYESIVDLISKGNNSIHLKYDWKYFIFIVPLIEEIIFRLHLNPKLVNIQISYALIIFYAINGKIFNVDYYSNFFFISILIVLFAVFLIKSKYEAINNFYIKNNKIISICSILIFGLFHLSNISILHYQISIFYIFFVLPQIILGYFITNIRLKFGFLWGLYLHFLINGISFVLFS